MERYLVIAIDKECNVYKTLMKDTNIKIDDFTSKFEDTYEMREHFKKEINSFLSDNSKLVSSLEIKNDRKETGDIVVNELDENGRNIRKSVVYKKQMVIFREIIKNRLFMDKMVNYNKILAAKNPSKVYFSDFICNVVKWDITYKENAFLKHISKWYADLKNDQNRYEIIRLFCKKYGEKYKELGLKSPDIIYKEYAMNKNLNKKVTKNNDGIGFVNVQESEIDLDREFIPDIDEKGKYEDKINYALNPHEREKVLYKPYKYDEKQKTKEENDDEQLKLT